MKLFAFLLEDNKRPKNNYKTEGDPAKVHFS